MSAVPLPAGRARSAILWGGLIAGTDDLIFAFAYYGLKLRVFQSVAAGLIGRDAAFAGGVPTLLLGVALHYLIASIWTALYWLASRRRPVLVKHAVPAGLAYGLIIFYGMNQLVLPLSALHAKAWPPSLPWGPVAMHMLIIGLPIALVVRKFSREPKMGQTE